MLNTENYVNTLGSLSGNHSVQHAKAGLKAIYVSGWQVAADANTAGEMYPDQSLYPFDSAPKLVESINNALIRADQIQHMELNDGDMKSENQIGTDHRIREHLLRQSICQSQGHITGAVVSARHPVRSHSPEAKEHRF